MEKAPPVTSFSFTHSDEKPIFVCPYCGGKTKKVTAHCIRCQYPHSGSDREKKQFLKSMLRKVKYAEVLSFFIWVGRIPLFLMFLLIALGTAPFYEYHKVQVAPPEYYPVIGLLFVIPGLLSIKYPEQLFLLSYGLVIGFVIYLRTLCYITLPGIVITGIFLLALTIGYLCARMRKRLVRDLVLPADYERMVRLTNYDTHEGDEDLL